MRDEIQYNPFDDAIEETLRLIPEWEVEEPAAEMAHTSTVRGYSKLPIQF